MPDGTATQGGLIDDPHAWALAQAALLAGWPATARAIDAEGLRDFLEERAGDMQAAVESHLVNLLSHMMKAAFTRNPQAIPHWLDECDNFYTEIQLSYRPSMAQVIRMDRVWRLAGRKVVASFARHGEPRPALTPDCPFDLAVLVDPDLNLEALVAELRTGFGPAA